MNTDQLTRVLEYICSPYNATYAVVASDELQLIKPKKFPLAVISNTDPSGEPGEHWVAFYMRKAKDPIEFFDSLSMNIREHNNNDFKKFIQRMSEKVIFMPRPLQCINSEFCGHYCLTFLQYRLANVYISYSYLHIFTEKCRQNDAYVNGMMKKWRRKIRKCKPINHRF